MPSDQPSDPRPQSAGPVEPNIFDLTPFGLISRYPHLPFWAVVSFSGIKSAYAGQTFDNNPLLLNIAFLPPRGFNGDKDELLESYRDDNIRKLFETEEKWNEWLGHAEACRLSRDILKSDYMETKRRTLVVRSR